MKSIEMGIEKNIEKMNKILNDKGVVEFKIYGLRYKKGKRKEWL